MELTAVIQALTSLKRRCQVVIYTDIINMFAKALPMDPEAGSAVVGKPPTTSP